MSKDPRQYSRLAIDLEALKNDSNSFLALHPDDPILHKLETYRLYLAGFTATDIAAAFGFTRPYLYEMWYRRFALRPLCAEEAQEDECHHWLLRVYYRPKFLKRTLINLARSKVRKSLQKVSENENNKIWREFH